jgi:hypothetical protein
MFGIQFEILIKGPSVGRVMDVPVLLDIYNRLTLMSEAEESSGGVGDGLDKEPRGFKDDAEEEEQPIGSFPEPKFKCYMVKFSGRIDSCTMSFIEYDDTPHLIFEFIHDYGDSGGICRCKVVCDKNSVVDSPIGPLYAALKVLTSEQQVLGVCNGIVQMRIAHIQCSLRNHETFWASNSILSVPLVPPDVQKKAYRIIANRCNGITRIIATFRAIAADHSERRLTLQGTIPPRNPPPGPETVLP